MSPALAIQPRRVLLVHWKNRDKDPIEVFSNLKLFCESYPGYSYNTLNNYLSKAKVPYENEVVRVERKELHTRPLSFPSFEPFRMDRTAVHKADLATHDEKAKDLAYWLSRTPQERIAAVTFLLSQHLERGQRLDRTFVKQRNLKDHGAK